MRRKLLILGSAVLAGALLIWFSRFRAAPTPSGGAVLNPEVASEGTFDLWGESISAERAAEMKKSPTEAAQLLSANGAVEITPELLQLGRRTFYDESFGNEIFITDVLGLVNGPLSVGGFVEAVAKLGGKGTTNLQVRLAKSARVGGREFRKGELIDTGLDVAPGAVSPLGVVIAKAAGGVPRIGISCAACHSTVDPQTMKVVHGAPNSDFRVGLLAALGTNTAGFVAHADITDLSPFVKNARRTVTSSDGKRLPLPDVTALENAVDAILLRWPPGTFDSMIDQASNPTQFTTSFTRDAWPYGWTGFSAIGPFHGLSSLNNNVHGLNSDPSTNADAAPALFGWDKELYVATLLQNAANPRYRFDPANGQRASEFFAAIDPTPNGPAFNEVVAAPTFPKGSLFAPLGLWTSSPKYRIWEQINAVSAWQNSLVPPPIPHPPNAEQMARGRTVFERASCIDCHSGPALTNHRIVPVEQIGTEPVRARSLRRMEAVIAEPIGWAFDQKVPLAKDARTITFPAEKIDREQVQLAFAWGGSNGGYKVTSLVGLAWSAPYLHDGGVAVGRDPTRELGVPGTLLRNIPADPRNSLRALIDHDLRQKVIAANASDPGLQAMNIRGIGHEIWVDPAHGFSPEDQLALIDYLLGYRPPW